MDASWNPLVVVTGRGRCHSGRTQAAAAEQTMEDPRPEPVGAMASRARSPGATRASLVIRLLAAFTVVAAAAAGGYLLHPGEAARAAPPPAPAAAAPAPLPGAGGGAAAARRAGLPVFTDLAREIIPSVVHIASVIEGPRPAVPPGHPFFGGPGGGGKAVGLGSGFVIDREGHILTNNHVVANASKVTVTFTDSKTEYLAEVVGTDPLTDIALIKVVDPPKHLKPVPFGDSDALEVGEWVVAIGSPFGLRSTVTAGIVSAKNRNIGAGRYDHFIQTDASINPGNSGGPLVNLEGKVIGVNTAIFSRSGGSIGIGFAIPINLARDVVEQLKTKGRVTRGWLGIAFQPVSPEMAEALGLDAPQGALVAEVTEGGPADEAGIEVQDVIVGWNGNRLEDASDLPLWVARTPPGSTATVEVLRDGKRRRMKVRMGELAPDGEPPVASGPGRARLGLVVQRMTPELARQLGLERPEGVVVTGVEPGSAAADATLQPGDVILSIKGEPIRSLGDYRRVINDLPEGRPVLFRVQRGDRTLFFALRAR